MKPLVLLAASCLVLAACQQQAETPDAPAATAPHGSALPPPPASVAAPTLTPAGAATPLEADATDELQWAASVVSIDELPNQGDNTIKLFGAGGGDPAMNGLQTFIAFFVDPSEGWRVFRIGDFLDYRVIGAAPGRVDLEIDESDYNDQTGHIGSRTRRLIVTWDGAGGEAPARVSVAEGR